MRYLLPEFLLRYSAGATFAKTPRELLIQTIQESHVRQYVRLQFNTIGTYTSSLLNRALL